MASTLVDTKLYVPQPRSDLVARPQLTERLEHGAALKLTLISAPPGFGKTTLLAEWLASSAAADRSVGWLSLDQADNEPSAFWNYLIRALQSAEPGIGANALTLLEAPQPPPLASVLATVLNELTAASRDVVLVLDDYHTIDATEIQAGMTFLLERLPPRAHLVIATRSDPALPLSRLRARGELVEIRAADLRFTPETAEAYLNEVMGLHLGASEVASLEARTEGWIAALQLAALSMRGRDDLAGFIARFAGDDRYIVDYLVEEVLQRQPEQIRSFLLQTSILDRMSGPLCDAITGQGGGRATLEALDRANLFVVPLDDQRQWYRYHHLFADVLRARLLGEEPGRVAELHRLASIWYERNGDRADAIEHALAGGDFERAADMIELAAPEMRRARLELPRRRWLEALPDEVLKVRPVLNVEYVGALMARGEFHDVEGRLRDAERWLDSPAGASGAMVVVDEAALRRLPSSIAMYRAAQAQLRGDVPGTLAQARQAIDLAGEDDHLERGGAAGFLALAHWGSGELEIAFRYWADAQEELLKADHVVDAIGCFRPLAEIRISQGRLRDAMSIYQRGLALAAAHRPKVLRGTADMHVGIGELLLEFNDLDAAAGHLLTGRELGDDVGLPRNPYRWHVAMARIREAEGDTEDALRLLREAERLYVSEYYPLARPIHAVATRIWIAQGRLTEAQDWVRERGLSIEDDLGFLSEFEHVTLARVLMAHSMATGDRPPMRDAVALLDRLRAAAEAGGRQGTVVEVLVLLLIARRALDDDAGALTALRQAMILAEPEGYVRTFVAEGAPMTALLEAAIAHGISPQYARRLLAAGDRQHKQPLEEPLSEREIEVLRLLATDLNGPDIASELVVALSTVRSHTKAIYAKLGVNSRRAAVRRGEELGLLTVRSGR